MLFYIYLWTLWSILYVHSYIFQFLIAYIKTESVYYSPDLSGAHYGLWCMRYWHITHFIIQFAFQISYRTVFPSPKPSSSKSIAEKSPAKKALFFVEEPEESKKKGDFVMLDTPFSVANTLDNPQGDLGVFFKEVQSAPQIMTECNRLSEADLESQLNSLGDQLSNYENKSAEYEGSIYLH